MSLKKSWISAVVLTLFLSVSAHAQLTDYSQLESERIGSTDYPRMFELARKLMTRQAVREYMTEEFKSFLQLTPEDQKALDAPKRIENFTEGQMITLLQRRPDLWSLFDKFLAENPTTDLVNKQRIAFRNLLHPELSTIKADPEMKRAMYPLRPVDVFVEKGPAYSETLYVGHQHEVDGKMVPGESLEAQIVDFIDQAKKQLMINVYDFDNPRVADALIRAAQRGVWHLVGIDEGNIEKYDRVKVQFERMKAAGVNVIAIKATGLNHQKLFVRDWSSKTLATSIDSSGNCTVSCISPYGEGERVKDSKYAIPNANHLRVIKGWATANVIRHELAKTLELKLYGTSESGFYTGGMFHLRGPNGVHKVMAFSPSGAAEDINKYMIRSALLTSRGPLSLAQFVLTSNEVGEALYQRAERDVRETGKFQMRAIVDSLQSLAPASEFLPMMGIGRVEVLNTKGKEVRWFFDDSNGRWTQLLGKEGAEQLRDTLRMAPQTYGNHSDQGVKMTSLMHHKLIIIPESGVVLDGSFNVSENALKNQEQFSMTYDKRMSVRFMGLFEGLYSQTTTADTIYARSQTVNRETLKDPKARQAVEDFERQRTGRTDKDTKQIETKAAPRPILPGQCKDLYKRAG